MEKFYEIWRRFRTLFEGKNLFFPYLGDIISPKVPISPKMPNVAEIFLKKTFGDIAQPSLYFIKTCHINRNSQKKWCKLGSIFNRILKRIGGHSLKNVSGSEWEPSGRDLKPHLSLQHWIRNLMIFQNKSFTKNRKKLLNNAADVWWLFKKEHLSEIKYFLRRLFHQPINAFDYKLAY